MERQPDYYPNPDSTREHVNALTADLADKIRPQLEMMPDDTSIFMIMGMTDKEIKDLNRALLFSNPPEQYIGERLERLSCPIEWNETLETLPVLERAFFKLSLRAIAKKGYRTIGEIRNTPYNAIITARFGGNLTPLAASFFKCALGSYQGQSLDSSAL